MTAATQTGMGIPRNAPWPRLRKLGGKPLIVDPLVTPRASPRATPTVRDEMDFAGQATAGASDRMIRRLRPQNLVIRLSPPCAAGEGRTVLMHPRDRRIDRDHPVQLPELVTARLDRGQDSLPGAILRPPVEPFEHRVPRPETFRQVQPRRPRPEPPRDSLDHHPMIQPRPGPTLDPRQQRLNHSPRLIRNHITLMHVSIVTQARPKSLDQQTLARSTRLGSAPAIGQSERLSRLHRAR
jgi:hypothetical protein